MIEHIAFIMDGNRRWAKKRGMLKMYGHREGADNIKTVIDFCLGKNIRYLSLYTFSIENFKRPKEEQTFLFDLMIHEADKSLKEMKEKEIRVRFIGDRSLFPSHVLPVCEKIERETATFSKLNVNFLFCYGARQEIIGGIKNIVKKVKAGEISEEDISDQVLRQNLWTTGIPEPDLIIRTGGQKRLSNFLLYQAAYSEFLFLDCLWPDLKPDDLETAFSNYVDRKRNFGV